jgi:hypothetical protein
LDRWARLRPALAATWLGLGCFYLNHLLLMVRGEPNEGGAFHWFATGLTAAWGLGAAVFQWLISRPRGRVAGTFGWAAFDVLMLTLVLLNGDGPHSALLPAYLLLIAGTALRLRISLIWLVTGLCCLSYLVLAAEAAWRRPALTTTWKDGIIFVLSLGILGLIQHFLLRRLRSVINSQG